MARQSRALREILPKDLSATVTVKVKIARKDKTADTAIAALHEMLDDNGAGFKALLREVSLATLFVAYSNRFNQRSSIMGRLVVEKSEGSAKKRAYYLVQLRRAERQLSEANPDTDAYYTAKNRVARYTAAYSGSKPAKEATLQGKRRVLPGGIETVEYAGPKGGSSGFRSRMQEVLERFKTTDGRSTVGSGDSATFRFGNIDQMDSVPTNAGNTPSTRNIMWRQLEFGAGVSEYVKKAGNRDTIPRLPGSWIPKRGMYSKQRREVDPQTGRSRVVSPGDGSWYAGSGANQVHILGSKAGNWLRTATGAAYKEDAQLFEPVFAARLSQRLRGRN